MVGFREEAIRECNDCRFVNPTLAQSFLDLSFASSLVAKSTREIDNEFQIHN